MDNRVEVREFLTSRRSRITPDQAGLPAYGGNRRVKGLRREEVALLASAGSRRRVTGSHAVGMGTGPRHRKGKVRGKVAQFPPRRGRIRRGGTLVEFLAAEPA